MKSVPLRWRFSLVGKFSMNNKYLFPRKCSPYWGLTVMASSPRRSTDAPSSWSSGYLTISSVIKSVLFYNIICPKTDLSHLLWHICKLWEDWKWLSPDTDRMSDITRSCSIRLTAISPSFSWMSVLWFTTCVPLIMQYWTQPSLSEY